MQRGYEVLDRNWRVAGGEIDLVVGSGRAVVFVEVKARATAAFGLPAEAVTPAKQQRIRRLAAQWLGTKGVHGVHVRFDVVAVLGNDLTVIENAF